MAKLGMYCKPCKAPSKAIVLRPHWQYQLKGTGDRLSRNYCDGSKRAASAFHAVTSTYSSSVDQPVQRLFFALVAINDHKVYGGDIKDTFAHSPSLNVPTYMRIDNVNSEWWAQRYNKNINRSHVLPVLCCLQGHPESGKIYEYHINQILNSKELNFKATVHDHCIYQTIYKGQKILLFRQTGDLGLATNDSLLPKISMESLVQNFSYLVKQNLLSRILVWLQTTMVLMSINEKNILKLILLTILIESLLFMVGMILLSVLHPTSLLLLCQKTLCLRSLLLLTIQLKALLLMKISERKWGSVTAAYMEN